MKTTKELQELLKNFPESTSKARRYFAVSYPVAAYWKKKGKSALFHANLHGGFRHGRFRSEEIHKIKEILWTQAAMQPLSK